MKKALSIAGKILTILIAVFSVGIMIFTIVSVNTIGKDAALFGYKPYIVTSNSMQDTFQAGDLTVSKQVDPAALEPGDIVTFRSIDPVNYGQVVTHKIKSITTYEGEPAFVTYGTTTGVEDAYPVPFSQVLGQYQFRLPGTFAPTADFSLLEKAVQAARKLEVPHHVGTVVSSDLFYGDYADSLKDWKKMGALAVEMESAGLYMNAARAGKKALALFTVSDLPLTGESLSAEDRQLTFTQMMEIALEIAE